MHAAIFVILSSGLATVDVPPPVEAAVRDLSSLQGTWRLVHQQTGTGGDEDVADDHQWTIHGDEILETWDGKETCRGTFSLNQAMDAYHIDFVWGGNVTRQLGIFRVTGRRLEIVVEDEDGPRPQSFSPAMPTVVVLTLLRVKK